jgi:alkylation response protein AidB-like acyl-CoA dehydrogenase
VPKGAWGAWGTWAPYNSHVNFDLSTAEADLRDKGAALGRQVAHEVAATTVVKSAARLGLLDHAVELPALTVAIEALAAESAAAGVILALHQGTALAVADDPRFSSLFIGDTAAAVGLSSDTSPVEQGGRLSGRASWVAPVTDRGIVVVGPRSEAERLAYAVALDAPGVKVDVVHTAALAGVVCGHIVLDNAACEPIGATLPIMTRIRILMAAAGLGIGTRALREALATARAAHTAAAGEQTVQGLLADAATDLDAARLMTWKAANAEPLSLADASLAKLMATAAAQRAVERTTQVVGVDSFQRGHVIERLAQDVRALELFAGRTEALRAAVAEELY